MRLKGKKVLVTGADGFIGSHLVHQLMIEGAEIRAFCFYNSFNSWGWLDTFSADTLQKIEIFTGDIRDPNGVRSAMKDVEIVYHLAALIAIPFSYHSPDAYVDTNIKGTLNVLQAARDSGVERILVTSTSEVYGTAIQIPIDEKHPRQGQSPYSATKISADFLSDSFFRSFDLPVTIVRPFNTYGPRQSARAIIPTIITQLLAGLNTLQLGDLTPTRDLVFVEDTARGFVEVSLCNSLIGEEVNIATGSEISIGDLAQKLIDEINPAARINLDNQRTRPHKSEVFRLLGDNTKLFKHTNWIPETDINIGLNKTIEWFRINENLSRYKATIYNI